MCMSSCSKYQEVIEKIRHNLYIVFQRILQELKKEYIHFKWYVYIYYSGNNSAKT